MPACFRLFDLPFDVRTRVYDYMIVDLLGGFDVHPYRVPSLVACPPPPPEKPTENLTRKEAIKARRSTRTREHDQGTDLSRINRLSVELLQHLYRWAEVKDGVPDQPINWVPDGCDCCFDPIYERYEKNGYRPFGRMIDRFHHFQIDLERDLFQEATENGRWLESCGDVEGAGESDLDPSDGVSFARCMFAVIVPQFARQPPSKPVCLRVNMAPLVAGEYRLDAEDEEDFQRVGNGLAALRALPNVQLQLYWGGPSSGHLPIRYWGQSPTTVAEFREVYEPMCKELQRIGLSWGDIEGAPDVERYDQEGTWPEDGVELALRFGGRRSESLPFGGLLFDGQKDQSTE